MSTMNFTPANGDSTGVADIPSAATTKAGGAWDTTEKYTLLLLIVKQLTSDGVSIKWTEVAKLMPGRTPKALTHAWANIKKEVTEAGGGIGIANDAFGTPAIPVTPATPKTRGKKQKTAPTSGEEGDGSPVKKQRKVATPRKKKGETPVKKSEEKAVDPFDEDIAKAEVKTVADDETKSQLIVKSDDDDDEKQI